MLLLTCQKSKYGTITVTLCSARPQLPVVDVVVLPSPPPVLIGEAVDLQELFFAQAWDSSKVSGVGQSEEKEENKKRSAKESPGCRRDITAEIANNSLLLNYYLHLNERHAYNSQMRTKWSGLKWRIVKILIEIQKAFVKKAHQHLAGVTPSSVTLNLWIGPNKHIHVTPTTVCLHSVNMGLFVTMATICLTALIVGSKLPRSVAPPDWA